MKSAHPFLAGIATLAGALIFASAVSRAQSADGIVVYNAQHASLTQAWADGFTKETGIKITLRNGGDTELGNQIVQEGVASPADVFLTENSPAMVLVDAAGLFAPVAADTLAQVPAIRDGRAAGPHHRRAQTSRRSSAPCSKSKARRRQRRGSRR